MGGGGEEYQGVDEGGWQGLKLLSWLHTVGLFFFSPPAESLTRATQPGL